MNKKPKRYILTHLWCLPAELFSWLTITIIWALWGSKLQWVEGTLWCELKAFSWPCRSWYRRKVKGVYKKNPSSEKEKYGEWKTWGGTTFIRGGFTGPGDRLGEENIIDTPLEFHEHVHVEQGEAAQLNSFIIGIAILITLMAINHTIVGVILGGIIWSTGALLNYATSSLQAIIRGEDYYKGNHLEESASSQTKTHKLKIK